MEPSRSRVGELKDGSWKKGNWLNRQKVRDDDNVYELELKIRMGHGWTGSTGGKNERGTEKQGFGCSSKPRSGHRSRVFLPEKAQPVSSTITSGISVNDYLVLLKSLCINLPNGVLNQKVIRLSENAGIIQKAQDIVKQLENFKFQFNSIPRLGCRELKNSLPLKDNGKILELTLMIFFEKRGDSEEALRSQWRKNVSNTSCGFRFRDKYQTKAVSTPTMYATTQTRSWRHLEVGDNLASISAGVTVNVRDIESRDYGDESALWTTSSPQRFGKYFQNPGDERECLKFYHELREIGTNMRVRYTKGNKVDFGFLSGRLDFLAEVKGEKVKKWWLSVKEPLEIWWAKSSLNQKMVVVMHTWMKHMSTIIKFKPTCTS